MSQDSFRVFITVFGKWQAFRLASQMARFGTLQRLYTAYPKAVTEVPPSRVVNLRALGLLHAALQRLGCDASASIGDRFDRFVDQAFHREKGWTRGLVHGWAGYCLRTLHAAKALGAVPCLERSSAHVTLQRQLVWEECDRWRISRSEAPFTRYQVMLEEYSIARRIIVPSDFVAQSFLEQGIPRDRLLIVPLGVDLELFRARPSDVERPPFRLLFVGGGTLDKGLGYLLQAWERLRLPEGELWIVCPSSKAPGYPGSPPRTRWWRHFDQRELNRIYWQCSVLCLPSVQDGFGMVVLEAMASGLPVIVSDHVGAKEIVRDGMDGFISPHRDVQALMEKIEALYRDPERLREMGSLASARAKEFSWDLYGERMFKEYRAIAAQAG